MNIILLISILFQFTQPINEFTIKGKVVGKESGTVRLGQIGESSIDSKRCSLQNGEFKFEGELDHPEEFFVSYQENEETRESNYFKFIVVPDTNNQIVLNPIEIEKSEFNGSSLGNQYYKLQQELRTQFDAERNKWRSDYMKAMDQNDSATISIIKVKFDSIKRREINWKKEFIIKNPDSYISALWLHKEQFNLRLDTLQIYFDYLDNSLQESKYYKRIKDFLAVQEGKPFVDFTLKDVSGKSYNLSSYASGKVILLDFWASWCKPCREHNVKLKELYEKNKSKGFEVVGISLDRETDSFIRAIKEDEMTWLNLIDRTDNTSVLHIYQNNAIPFNVLIDVTGIIAYRATDYINLEKEVNRLVQNK